LKAFQFLDESTDGVAQAVNGLSEAQWKFKPEPSRWSIAEVVEHLALAENFFVSGVRPQLIASVAALPNAGAETMDGVLVSKTRDRSVKYQAPPPLLPGGRWPFEETLRQFLETRRQTAAFSKSVTDLRGYSANHPAFGSLDGYQWILVIAAHSARHTGQILEVQADPNFPAN
jgi:hypothetical protein